MELFRQLSLTAGAMPTSIVAIIYNSPQASTLSVWCWCSCEIALNTLPMGKRQVPGSRLVFWKRVMDLFYEFLLILWLLARTVLVFFIVTAARFCKDSLERGCSAFSIRIRCASWLLLELECSTAWRALFKLVHSIWGTFGLWWRHLLVCIWAVIFASRASRHIVW